MLDFKGCPRCGGDLHLSRDQYGSYKECLQCGYVEDVPDRVKVGDAVAEASEELVPGAA
ncbi:MAG: hypothetical protein HY535_06060 [Chloroflexi bacterium]|nr:hypothetical protein [Chloroflexota bacterium]